MSDTTFMSDIVADMLNMPHSAIVNLKVSTVNSGNPQSKPSKLFQQLDAKGFYGKEKISLTEVYTIPEIPVNASHIPTKQSTADWGHLRDIAPEIPEQQDCPIGLLIGYDNSQALIPLKSVTGPNLKDPYAIQTPLGWSVVGATKQNHNVVRFTNTLQSSIDRDAVTFTAFLNP